MRPPLQIASILVPLFLLAGCGGVQQKSVKNTARTFSTVVVDAGHGGRDSGAFRRFGPPEKSANLDVALRLNKKLKESQFKTVMTRSGDVFIPLDQRAVIGNAQRNSIFVSIHFNDSRRRGIHGFETYYHSAPSANLAQNIQRKLMTLPGSENRGVHTANFRVLRKANYPAVLVECGFLSNRREGGGAARADYRDQLADKIAEAIVEERYGAGIYHGAPQTAEQAASPAVPPGRAGEAPAGFFRN